jgi:hypothetical protein
LIGCALTLWNNSCPTKEAVYAEMQDGHNRKDTREDPIQYKYIGCGQCGNHRARASVVTLLRKCKVVVATPFWIIEWVNTSVILVYKEKVDYRA